MSLFQRSHRNIDGFRPRLPPNAELAESAQFAMLSHAGRVRKGNEDTCAAELEAGAFVVCDGMGGAAAGEVASALATQMFLEALRAGPGESPEAATDEARLNSAVVLANRAVFRQARSAPDLQGMGTTLVGLLYRAAEGSGAEAACASLTLVHVGDSRCYRWRGETLAALTLDHSLVEEQVRAGEMTALEAETHPMRNIITRAVGTAPWIEPEIQTLEPRSGDLYLLASDGLTRELRDVDVADLLKAGCSAGASLGSLAQALVDRANDAGGGDNITVLLLRLP